MAARGRFGSQRMRLLGIGALVGAAVAGLLIGHYAWTSGGGSVAHQPQLTSRDTSSAPPPQRRDLSSLGADPWRSSPSDGMLWQMRQDGPNNSQRWLGWLRM